MCFIAVGITEGDLSERGASAWIVDDFFDDATDVAMSLCIVKGSELSRRFVEASVGRWIIILASG